MSTTAGDPPGGGARGPVLLEIDGLSKTFPGVLALDRLSLTVRSSEVLALVGQNGSGKSTLIKILAGVYRADPGGSVRFAGAGGDGADAARGRLHFIHQDLGLVPMLSTLENLDLGRRLGCAGLLPVRRRREHDRARELIARFGASFDVRMPVERLSPAERTIVAIARALDGWSSTDNVLVLDEPTATLHGSEVTTLLQVVRQVADAGAGVVFVSHRLDEVVTLADTVVVLRDGRVVADTERGRLDHDALVRLIAGRELPPAAAGTARSTGAAAGGMVARGLSSETLRGVDLSLRPGEILGVAGLVGSGMEQLAGTLFGAVPRRSGSVRLDGRELPPASPARSVAAGVGFVPADRRRHGAVVTMNARENLTLARLSSRRRALSPIGRSTERAETRRWMRETEVRPADPERRFALFSGGNQQKIVLAKWMRLAPRVLLLQEPTQGVDVGAKAGIYALLRRAAAAGAGILVASSDCKELAELCDRVIVLVDGRVGAELARPQLTEAALVRATLGPGTTDPAALAAATGKVAG